MKSWKNQAILVLLTLLLLLSSCRGGKKPGTGTEPVGTEPGGQDTAGTILDTSLPDTLDYGGAEIHFLVRDAYKSQFVIDGASMNEVDEEVAERKRRVESLLNVSLKFTPLDAAYGEANNAYLARVRNDTLSSSPEYDVYDLYGYYAASLAAEGCYYNLHSIASMDFNREYWNASLVEETTYNNVMYLMSGPICLTETQNTVALVYNKNMLSSLYPEADLYSVVDSNKWTYDYMGTLLTDLYDDKGTADIMDDRWGLGAYRIAFACDALLVSGGLHMIQRDVNDNFRFTFQDADSVDRFDKLYSFLHRYEAVYNPANWNNGKSLDLFESGNMLFLVALFDHITTISENEPTFKYGILPLPKLNAGDPYTTNVADYQSYLAIPGNAGIARTDMIGAVLETMASYSDSYVRPVYFERMCKGRYSDLPDDARMFDLINNSIVCNFGQVYSSAIGDPLWAARGVLWKDSNNYSDYIKERIETYEKKLDELIGKLDIIG